MGLPAPAAREPGSSRRPSDSGSDRHPGIASPSPIHSAGASVLLSRGSTPSSMASFPPGSRATGDDLRRPPSGIVRRGPPLPRSAPAESVESSESAIRPQRSHGDEAELVVDAGEEAVAAAAADLTTGLLPSASGPLSMPSTAAPSTGAPSARAPGLGDDMLQQKAQPDRLTLYMLQEQNKKLTSNLARLSAAPEVLADLDLPSLAALRAELIREHQAALERIDDRRVLLQARQARAQGPDPGRCVACWVRKADRVLLPCRHLCVCGACLHACQSKCPVCRSPVTDHIEVFGTA